MNEIKIFKVTPASIAYRDCPKCLLKDSLFRIDKLFFNCHNCKTDFIYNYTDILYALPKEEKIDDTTNS